MDNQKGKDSSNQAANEQKDHVAGAASLPKDAPDPLLLPPPSVVREGDTVILVFGDGRQIFAQCLTNWKGKTPPVKINKRSYPTANLVGLPYGTVLELGIDHLRPLPEGEDIIPEITPSLLQRTSPNPMSEDDSAKGDDSTFPPLDNRNLVDNNTSQSMDQSDVQRLREVGTHGSTIVDKLIENSATFDSKTEFSKAKYVARKQMKYQPRCRMVRCTASTICQTQFLKDPRRILNMREDTLGQILSYSNVCAGCQVLVFDNAMGIVTGALAQRMGGYGKVLSIFMGQQPSFLEMLQRFNLSFAENNSIKWLHAGDVFADDARTPLDPKAPDPDKAEREALEWPCPLQDHTRNYMENMAGEREQIDFLAKRCARFARKLTRHTPMEAKEWLLSRPCDSVVIVARYDPTATLLALLPYLAPSCPFVVYCEFLEPLTECFREIQRQDLAINLRLSDVWYRQYQMLPGRTHPFMNMSQSGGFILTGIKLCPVTGHNELDDELLKELRSQIGRRGKKNKHKNANNESNNARGPRKIKLSSAATGRETKRPRLEDES